MYKNDYICGEGEDRRRKSILKKKRLFQFIIERATNYTYVGLNSHRYLLGVVSKIAKILVIE